MRLVDWIDKIVDEGGGNKPNPRADVVEMCVLVAVFAALACLGWWMVLFVVSITTLLLTLANAVYWLRRTSKGDHRCTPSSRNGANARDQNS